MFNLPLCLICGVPDTRACCLIPPPRVPPSSPSLILILDQILGFNWLCLTSVNRVIDYILTFGVSASALGGFLCWQVIFVVM